MNKRNQIAVFYDKLANKWAFIINGIVALRDTEIRNQNNSNPFVRVNTKECSFEFPYNKHTGIIGNLTFYDWKDRNVSTWYPTTQSENTAIFEIKG